MERRSAERARVGLALWLGALGALAPALAEEPAHGANEMGAVGALKTICNAQSMFRELDKDRNGVLDYAGEIADLHKHGGLIDQALASGRRSGYAFRVTRGKGDQGQFLWMASASPLVPGETGERHFAVNQAGVIYHSYEPFAHRDDCQLPSDAVPIGRPLPERAAQGPPAPKGSLGWVVAAAERAGVKLEPGVFLVRKAEQGAGPVVAFVQRRLRADGGRLEAGTVDGAGMIRVREWVCSAQGTAVRGAIHAGRVEDLKEERPAVELRCARQGDDLVLRGREGGKPARRVVPGGARALPLEVVLYGLAPLADHLEGGRASLSAFSGWEPPAACTLAPSGERRPGGGPGERAVVVQHAKLGTATLWVASEGAARGRILALRDFDGSLLEAASEEEARLRMMKLVPEAARRDLEGARRAANEAAAIGALKTLSTAQALYRELDKDQNGVLDYAPDLAALGRLSLIDPVLASGTKNGYRFQLCRSDKQPEYQWMAVASPITPGTTGARHFATDHRGIVWYSSKPIPLDRATCEVKDATPVGR